LRSSSPTSKHTHFFIDPSKDIGVVVTKRKLPVDGEAPMKVHAGVEEADATLGPRTSTQYFGAAKCRSGRLVSVCGA
jgi:hypothetical protein